MIEARKHLLDQVAYIAEVTGSSPVPPTISVVHIMRMNYRLENCLRPCWGRKGGADCS
jgi:hypothetical protein